MDNKPCFSTTTRTTHKQQQKGINKYIVEGFMYLVVVHTFSSCMQKKHINVPTRNKLTLKITTTCFSHLAIKLVWSRLFICFLFYNLNCTGWTIITASNYESNISFSLKLLFDIHVRVLMFQSQQMA